MKEEGLDMQQGKDHGDNAMLVDFFENAPELFIALSHDLKIVFVNKAWGDQLSYDITELKKSPIEDLIDPKYWQKTSEEIEVMLRSGETQSLETVLLAKDGERVFVRGSINCQMEEGKPKLIRAIFHDITDQVRTLKNHHLYGTIASLIFTSKDIDQLYTDIHKELQKVMEARNFSIALYDVDENQLSFPYYVDETNHTDSSFKTRTVQKGLTERCIFSQQAELLTAEEIKKLEDRGELEVIGPHPSYWIGVPLKVDKKVTGAIMVQTYTKGAKLTSRDLEMLQFMSGQIALAIERKQNEMKIAAQSARVGAIFESSSHLIWSIDRQGVFTSFNNNFIQNISTLTGKDFSSAAIDEITMEVFAPDEIEFWMEKYSKVFQEGTQNFEIHYNQADGTDVWRQIYLNPINIGHGDAEEISGIAHEITEKKLSDIALQKSEEQFRNIFESLQDIYFRIDRAGIIQKLSPSISEYGLMPEHFVGRHITLFVDTQPHIYRRLLKILLTRGTVRNFETAVSLSDDQTINTLSNIRLIYENGRPIAIEGVAKDFTELKEMNRELVIAKDLAERSLEVKANFLANMSHEIRTPMTGVIGMLGLLEDSVLTDSQKSQISAIRQSAETLLEILNNVLDLSKIEAGKMQLKPVDFDLRDTLQGLTVLFGHEAKSKGLNFLMSIAPDVPKIIFTDRTRLIQVVSNLLSNAIKFTIKGDVKLNVGLVEDHGRDVKLKLTISDTGIGIPKRKQSQLFQKFTQIDSSVAKNFQGTGLGLSISKQLAELLGGDIITTSAEGEGSKFDFYFEAQKGKEHEKEKKYVDLSYLHPDILIVDDNNINRQVAGSILSKAGCAVSYASSGAAAIEKLSRYSFSLILMDIQMPNMDGVETTKVVREKFRDLKIPIIAMTAYAEPEDRQRFIEAGMDDYIPKPLDSVKMLEVVRDWIGGKSKESNLRPDIITDPAEQTEHIADLPDIDWGKLESLTKYGGDDIIEESLNEFVYESEELIKNSFSDLKHKDFKSLLSRLHTLKGNAGTLGMSRLYAMTAELESEIKEDTGFDAEENLNLIAEALETVKSSIPRRRMNEEKKRVMIAEDSSVIQNLTSKILKHQNYEVISVKNGQQVLDKLSKMDFSVILLDITMPVMDGMECAKQIRAMDDKKKSQVPIIAITGNSKNYSLADFRAVGINEYMQKPLDFDVLVDLVKDYSEE